nr:HAD family hydrolase [Haliscomenobacter sp.]
MQLSKLSATEKKHLDKAMHTLASDGYRLLGVAEAIFEGSDFPATQQEFPFQFKGLVAFYDPPKHNIQKVLKAFYKAGITVKIVTGDNAATTSAIAQQVGFKGYEKAFPGMN